MDNQRYKDIMDGKADLTQEEINQGWHFCVEWDFMLINKNSAEGMCCRCNLKGVQQ